MAESNDPKEKFCKEKILYKMSMPEYVPLDDMNKLICETDWELAISQISSPQASVQSMINEVRSNFIFNIVKCFDKLFFWSQFV